MTGYQKHSGPTRGRVVRTHEPTGPENYQTKPISHNPQGINGLRLVSSTAGRSARQNPPDRSSGTRRDLRLRAVGPQEQQGNNGPSEQKELPKQQDDQTKPIQNNSHIFSNLHDAWEGQWSALNHPPMREARSVPRTSTAPFRAGLCLVWAGLGRVASALWAAGGNLYHAAA